MYGKYVLKRAGYGILMYVIMIFVYSTLFNSVADRTMSSLIDEQVAQEMTRYKSLDEAQRAGLREERIQAKRRQYHLDEPLASRIFWRGVDTITFNFRNSTIIKASDGDRRVLKIVGEALPRTIVLFTTEAALVTVVGVMMGLGLARKPNGPLDRFNSGITMITNGLPAWWLGMLMIMVFSYALPVFPSGGIRSNPPPESLMGVLDYLWHLALPLVTLTLLGLWSTAYITRNIVLSNLQEDYIMAARARGVPERLVLFSHTLRSSMPAIMTLAILGLFGSIAGNIIVEGIFGWPGIGNLYFVAVQQNDVPVLMATLAIETLINMGGFVLLDIVYGLLDPRIKTGGRA